MIYLDLLLGFLEVGLFSFGGAYAAIPLVRDVVLAHGWMDDEMLSYMIAVSESTPGPIMVNLATYVGSNKGGFFGAVIVTTVVMLPAFLIILLIMVIAKNLLKNPYMQAILRGLKPCVIGVILATGVYMIVDNRWPCRHIFRVKKNQEKRHVTNHAYMCCRCGWGGSIWDLITYLSALWNKHIVIWRCYAR